VLVSACHECAIVSQLNWVPVIPSLWVK
jgi:hypothetical protein